MHLQLRLKEQERVVKAKKREHHMCLREVIININEMEQMIGKKV